MTNLPAKICGPQADEGLSHPLFKASPIPSLIVGSDGLVQSVNAATLTQFGCGTAELVAKPLASLIPELGPNVARLQSVVRRRAAVRRPNGQNFVARVQLVSLGIAGPVLATIEDLSDWEQEIAAANKELETFMSAAGHDLRGPLRILKGFTEALDDECAESLNDDGKTFLKEIVRAADRMEGLIDALLALSRAGRAEMHCENLDISMLADMALYDLRHAKNARDVDVHVDAGLTAWGDVRLMMVVLRTLLGNAWKYTGRTASPQVRLYSEVREGRACLCISDNGAGFDMAHAERLFQPFTRLHRQDEFMGHGLGLATVRRILRRHGGDIEADARVNHGATFRFWLRPAPAN